jgi:hypothetical protein
MAKNIARLYKEDVGGFGDGVYARTYQLDPPIIEDGLGYQYATIAVYAAQKHHGAKVKVFYTTAFGTAARSSMREETGSFSPNGDPHQDGQHHLDGCFVWALAANDYEIEGYGAQKLPAGLDYDPNVVPEYESPEK